MPKNFNEGWYTLIRKSLGWKQSLNRFLLCFPAVNMFTFIQSKNPVHHFNKVGLAVCSTAAPPMRRRAAATEELSTYKGVYNTRKQI